MRELSLHILDIAENSIKAKAKLIIIDILSDTKKDRITIKISDDGIGMDEEMLSKVCDPFTTTRSTRKVGMGIPLFKMAAEDSGGEFSIISEVGKGTSVIANFVISSIDRMPLGEIEETLGILIMGSPEKDFLFDYTVIDNDEKRTFNFDTREIKEQLSDVPIETYEVICFIKKFIKENIKAINGGLIL